MYVCTYGHLCLMRLDVPKDSNSLTPTWRGITLSCIRHRPTLSLGELPDPKKLGYE